MSVRSAVRDAQRQLAVLDAAYARARDRLEKASARRAEAIAEHDQAVSDAKVGIERAVADMVAAIGPAMTAELLGLEIVEVRRMTRRHAPRDEHGTPPSPAIV